MSRPHPIANVRVPSNINEPALCPSHDAPIVVPLGHGRSIAISNSESSARLQICAPIENNDRAALDIEIRFTTQGPTVSVRATTLMLEAAEHVVAHCETFAVHARERIELESGGSIVQHAKAEAVLDARRVEINASPGAISLRANDEVQLLGEMILLNSERPTPLPAWLEHRIAAEIELIPTENESGDPAVIDDLRACSTQLR
jgi:hypothetical protein